MIKPKIIIKQILYYILVCEIQSNSIAAKLSVHINMKVRWIRRLTDQKLSNDKFTSCSPKLIFFIVTIAALLKNKTNC